MFFWSRLMIVMNLCKQDSQHDLCQTPNCTNVQRFHTNSKWSCISANSSTHWHVRITAQTPPHTVEICSKWGFETCLWLMSVRTTFTLAATASEETCCCLWKSNYVMDGGIRHVLGHKVDDWFIVRFLINSGVTNKVHNVRPECSLQLQLCIGTIHHVSWVHTGMQSRIMTDSLLLPLAFLSSQKLSDNAQGLTGVPVLLISFHLPSQTS